MSSIHTFGPFRLDVGARQLTRDGAALAVSARHFDVLVALAARAGTVITKDALVEAAWRDVAVTDNSLEQAVSALRRTLGTAESGQPYIETVPRQGYRFGADVHTQSARASDEELAALMAPHRAWVEGRAALEALDARRVAVARAAFEGILRRAPHDLLGHVGLANACAMQFEATRADAAPDLAALAKAAEYAREACRLDPTMAEAWATQAFVLDRTGQSDEARSAAARAVSLEPDNWRHHFRLALVSWGEARLRAARRTLALLPGLPLAHWLAATVYVARQAFDDAERELGVGIESMRATGADAGVKFPGVALEWLLGLIQLSRGDEDQALERFARELALESHAHLYTRESCANAWYAIGAVHLHHGRRGDASMAFGHALERVARHPAAIALAALTTGSPPVDAPPMEQVSGLPRALVDHALAQSVFLAVAGDHGAAASRAGQALGRAEPGSQAWWLPVEPLLRVTAHPAEWA
ncbi:MAG TPA: transcriptional regulator, partial [Vicinamibacterales bacterium]